MSVAEPLTFEQVQLDALGAGPAPHYARGGSFAVWSAPGFGGIFATGQQRLADLEQVSVLFPAFVARKSGVRLFIDARAFGVDGSILDAVLHRAPGLQPMYDQIECAACVLPAGWTRAWWVGAFQMGVWNPVRSATFAEPQDAWDWLKAPRHLPASVESLREQICADPALRTRVEDALRHNPSHSIESVAASMRLSPRTLQRGLRTARETFEEIRDRVRGEAASSMLASSDLKVEVIASMVGFRSRSHFVSWFRKRTGRSPGEFRRLAAETTA